MSRLNLQRNAIRVSYQASINELENELDKEEDSTSQVKMMWKRTEDRFIKLERLDNEIWDDLVMQDVSQEQLNDEFNEVQIYRDKWNDINCRIDLILQSGDSTVRSTNETKRYKLPKLKLVEFDGNPRKWLGFWSQFKGIHDDNELSAEERFQYLIQATEVDSEARRVVASFPPTGENYQKAIDHLKSRFGKDNVLIEVYIRDLLKLVLSNVNGQQKVQLATLYDQLETQLRSLESLGVTTDKYAAMLYPLVESALSEDVLRAWERTRNQRVQSGEVDQLSLLMAFLQSEVESDVRLKMAKRGITQEDEQWYESTVKRRATNCEYATVTDLLNGNRVQSCVFCGKYHPSHECYAAKKMSVDQRLDKIRAARNCFRCLKGNHISKECRLKLSCTECKGDHYRVMCRAVNNEQKPLREINAVSKYTVRFVYLQTLLINVEHQKEIYVVRALIDGGSEKSYIRKCLVQRIGIQACGEISIAHLLFGGHITKVNKHLVYKVNAAKKDGTAQRQLELLDVETICGQINAPSETCIKELEEQGISLSDVPKINGEIDILIGADIASTLYTGRMYHTSEGPVAFETKLGWTMTGTTNLEGKFENPVLLSHSFHVSNAKVTDLWRLDVIGINDPVENQSRDELAESALKHFKEKVRRLDDGRYEVELPWIEGHQPVSTNLDLAKIRLKTTMAKLQRMGKINEYDQLLDKWLSLGVIEEVPDEENGIENVSYLPHHAVFKPNSSTTPIRPVFDASAKSKGNPSLNDCLEKGHNMIEVIPSLLIRFRMKRYGSTSDIEKAFLQISVAKKDRDYLRFLWYKNGEIRIYRHCRVVFGVKSSPFLLAATLFHHLENAHEKFEKISNLIRSSTYVDNCVVSVDTKEELDEFVNDSKEVCAEAKFNLRNFVCSRGDSIAENVSGVGTHGCGLRTSCTALQVTSNVVSVLGLSWNADADTLSLDLRTILNQPADVITKRRVLAATHMIFDPLGFVSPVTIVPKMMLQEIVKKKVKWDDKLPEDIAKRFKVWLKSIESLQALSIPRWVMVTNGTNKSIHVFTDASKGAYTAVAYLRSENEYRVNVQLIMSKARVSTIKPVSIPRLELIACELGAKLIGNVRDTIDMTDIITYMWSDSSNALSWIKRNENWQKFVFNRVKKIREYSRSEEWRHIPGNLNPADLPSRGCTSKQLLNCRWWEGPDWLRHPEEYWPKSDINCDENIVMAEKKKIVVSHLVQETDSHRYFQYFSRFRRVVRMVAWMRRWITYKRSQHSRVKKELTIEEEKKAEKSIWKMAQNEHFTANKGIIKQLRAVKDDHGLWRVKTKLLMRKDYEDFKCPILLPKNNVAVECMMRHEHLFTHHSGAPILRSNLREQFWIINARVLARSTVNKCGRCKRFGARKFTAPEAPLPLNRVRDAAVFEVTGIDLGGPLYLKDGSKVWFAVFTCAVYRALHLELVSSLSTGAFIQALRRFIARRGRPEIIYVDNGGNFVGTENLLKRLDWDEILATTLATKIKWIFNPPKAPWWGGWWERIVGMVKQLLLRNLVKKLVDFEEMTTILCDLEQLINSRPLTYLTEDPNELIALTPSMFLNELRSHEVIDLDTIESTNLNERYKELQDIRQELRDRFRKEYLSQLVHQNVRTTGHTNIKVGDLVLVEVENKKRINWPVAQVTELFPGCDGVVRSVEIRTKNKTTTRPIQKLYLLETSLEELEKVGLNMERKSKGIDMEIDKGNGMEIVKESDMEKDKESDVEKDKENDMKMEKRKGNGMEKNVKEIKEEDETKKVTRSGRIVRKPNRL